MKNTFSGTPVSADVIREPSFGLSRPVSSSGTRFQMAEYVYYGLVFYSLMGNAFGISIPLFGIGGLAALAAFTVVGLKRNLGPLRRRALLIPLLCSGSFVAIQMVVHGESLRNDNVRFFIAWVLSLIVVQSLCLRPGFIRRFSVFTFLVALTVLPFLSTDVDSRATLSASTGLSNANALASWFGFCGLAFTIRGLETRRPIERWLAWGIALLSMLVIGMTVSRGALAAVAVGLVVASRKRLRRGFLPVLALMVVTGVALVTGVFDQAIEMYSDRGLEESGRFIIWPVALQRALEFPLAGVGVSNVAVVVPTGQVFMPHNGPLFIATTAGFIPLLFFLAYWFAGLVGARKGSQQNTPDSAYLLPLLVYAVLVCLTTDTAFADSWVTVSLCICMHYYALARTDGRASVRSGLPAPRLRRI